MQSRVKLERAQWHHGVLPGLLPLPPFSREAVDRPLHIDGG